MRELFKSECRVWVNVDGKEVVPIYKNVCDVSWLDRFLFFVSGNDLLAYLDMYNNDVYAMAIIEASRRKFKMPEQNVRLANYYD